MKLSEYINTHNRTDDEMVIRAQDMERRIAELEAGLRIALNNHKTGCKCDCCRLLDGRGE